MNAEKNIPLKMIRENLEDIPQFALPEGFSLRWFQPGDEKVWRKIQAAADKFIEITAELFAQQFGNDEALLSQRQCYLLDAHGNPIGTTTAWFNDNFEGARVGRVHWVAILPEHQGKGLSKPLMLAVCRRLKELGHTRTYLSTSSARIPAIKLYLQFGFTPLIHSENDAEIWRELEKILKR